MSCNRADRFLAMTLLLSLIVHGFALLTMASILLPSMPGPGLPAPALRLAHLAAHPWLWHAAWIPWHLSALSDIALSAAFVACAWVPRRYSLLTLALTLVAFAIEQRWEVAWNALAPGFSDPAVYAIFEQHADFYVTVVAAALYGLMAIGWTVCVFSAGTAGKWLLAVSVVAWPALLFGSLSPLLHVPDALGQIGNKVGFVLLIVWYVLALEAVLRRTRPELSTQQTANGKILQVLLASRAARYVVGLLSKAGPAI